MSVYENLDEQKQFACRVIADHARTTAFSIADGILPGNEGRAYVLRKIMRRAIYHGREHLGFHEAFFYKVCNFVVDQMRDAYPELETQREFISKMVRLEEKRFGATMTVGLEKLQSLIKEYSKTPLSVERLAQLYDTFGTPIDLIYHIVSGHKLFIANKENPNLNPNIEELSEEDFRKFIESELKLLQRQNGVGQTIRNATLNPIYAEIAEKAGANKFHGYDTTQIENAKVVAIIKDEKQIEELKQDEEGLIVLDETPFYAESGGQVGDIGFLTNETSKIKVQDTFAPVKDLILHKSKVEKGSIKVGDALTATVDAEKRDATRRNHTATHLVHAALREVLGTHVKQAGSVVAPNYLRFDFTHYQPISDEEIRQIEDLVNREILKNDAVNTDIKSIEEAMQSGAMALFGEKYGADVRVLSIGEGTFSKELCGGTHVRATGDIGSFKITSDEAVASGVRRIRAITGFDAFERFRDDERMIDESLGFLKTQRDQLPNAIERLQEELKRMRRENDELKMKIATGAIGNVSSNGDEAKEINGVKVIAKTVEGLDKGGMRHLSDTLLAKIKSGVVVLARTEEDKVSFIVRVSDDLTDKVKAGKIVQEIAPIVSGRGGGKPDMAEGGGTDASKLDDALQASYGVVEQMLES